MRILIAEDEPDLNNVINKTLQREGYIVDSCLNGEDAYEYILFTKYDVILLDIMMPKMDGLTVLKKLRSKGILVPVIFLTAKDQIDDRVTGLDAGANDYLVKPFSFRELLARIRAVTRQAAGKTDAIYKIADLTVDTEKKQVFRGDNLIELSGKEYGILEYLIRNQGIVLSREKIEESIYNYDSEVGSNVIDVFISYLRKKIDGGYEPKLIHTVRNMGYVLKIKE